MVTKNYLQNVLKPISDWEFFIDRNDLENEALKKAYTTEYLRQPYYPHFIQKQLKGINVDGFDFKEENDIDIENKTFRVMAVTDEKILLLLIAERIL